MRDERPRSRNDESRALDGVGKLEQRIVDIAIAERRDENGERPVAVTGLDFLDDGRRDASAVRRHADDRDIAGGEFEIDPSGIRRYVERRLAAAQTVAHARDHALRRARAREKDRDDVFHLHTTPPNNDGSASRNRRRILISFSSHALESKSGRPNAPLSDYSSTFRMAMNASWGTSTLPIAFMRFLPAFCFSSSLRLREMSPP